MYKRPKGDPRPPALSLVQPEKHCPDLGPQLRGLLFTPRAGWGRRRRASASSSPTTIISSSVATQPRMPPADTCGPGTPLGPHPFEKFYIFPIKTLTSACKRFQAMKSMPAVVSKRTASQRSARTTSEPHALPQKSISASEKERSNRQCLMYEGAPKRWVQNETGCATVFRRLLKSKKRGRANL